MYFFVNPDDPLIITSLMTLIISVSMSTLQANLISKKVPLSSGNRIFLLPEHQIYIVCDFCTQTFGSYYNTCHTTQIYELWQFLRLDHNRDKISEQF